MQLFNCGRCNERVFFENLRCSCGCELYFDPEAQKFEQNASPCANRAMIHCNWRAEDGASMCRSCAMTEVTPDISVPENVALWADAERSKRWVLATLGRWGWFAGNDMGRRPVFHMLAEATRTGAEHVMMGHQNGVVTINVSEADAVERLRRGAQFGEPQRTMMGHFRHELGHFVYERLSARDGFQAQFRSVFGDESADYGQALDYYYQYGPAQGWGDRFISAYASVHPLEDWAESFAHMLHLTDIVDSFAASRMTGPNLAASGYDAYRERDAARLIDYGARLGVALNHVNRSMGLQDIYPFLHTPAVVEKLKATHRWIVDEPHPSVWTRLFARQRGANGSATRVTRAG